MSSDPSNTSSPSNSQIQRATSEIPATLPERVSSSSTTSSAETPQVTAGIRSQSTPPILILDRRSITSNPRSELPLLCIQNSEQTAGLDSCDPRQGRPLVARNLPRTSSSQPPRRVLTPYTRPTSLHRADSQPHLATMSSASTPSNTSTSGSGQLPYAPFPYPAPANAGQGGKGKGK